MQILKLLNTLSNKEQAAFFKYLQLKKRKSTLLIQFANCLFKYKREATAELKKKVFTELFPGESYRDERIRQLSNRLLQQLDLYKAQNRIETQKLSQYQSNLNDHSNQDVFHLRQLKNYRKEINQIQVQDEQYYQHHLQSKLHETAFAFQSAQTANRIFEPDFNSLHFYADQYYTLQKLKIICTELDYSRIRGQAVNQERHKSVIEYFIQHNLLTEPIIRLYYLIYLILQTEQNADEYFDELMLVLERESHLFKREQLREMYIYAQNYCIRQINRGQSNHLRSVFTIYKRILESGLILNEGVLSPWDYKNISVTALRLGENDWCRNFIEQYKSLLPKNESANAYTYNLAKLHFYQGDYQQVLSLLTQVEYNDIFYGLDSRSMIMKSFFELDEADSLFSLMESFKIFLYRKKVVSEAHRLSYGNLIRFCRRIYNVRKRDKKSLDKLRSDLMKISRIADKEWILEKLAEKGAANA